MLHATARSVDYHTTIEVQRPRLFVANRHVQKSELLRFAPVTRSTAWRGALSFSCFPIGAWAALLAQVAEPVCPCPTQPGILAKPQCVLNGCGNYPWSASGEGESAGGRSICALTCDPDAQVPPGLSNCQPGATCERKSKEPAAPRPNLPHRMNVPCTCSARPEARPRSILPRTREQSIPLTRNRRAARRRPLLQACLVPASPRRASARSR